MSRSPVAKGVWLPGGTNAATTVAIVQTAARAAIEIERMRPGITLSARDNWDRYTTATVLSFRAATTDRRGRNDHCDEPQVWPISHMAKGVDGHRELTEVT